MRVAIKSAGVNGRKLCEYIRKSHFNPSVEVVMYAEQSANLIGEILDGIPVYSDYKVMEAYRKGGIDYLIIPAELYRMNIERGMAIHNIVDKFVKLGMSNDDIRVSNVLWKQKPICADFDSVFVTLNKFCHIRYLEFPIAYHCNLNCVGCSHFSGLVNNEFPVYENVERDFHKLKELVPHIGRIRILGGEPLLNKSIEKYILLVRELFPYSEINVVTNGIMIPQMSKQLINAINKNDIIMNISLYPPLQKSVDSIIAFLKSNSIKCTLSDICDFMPTFSKSKEIFPYKNLDETCQFYYFADGCISSCVLMHDIIFFNRYFNINYPGNESMISVYEEGLNGPELIRRLKIPGELCNYCSMYKHMSSSLDALFHKDINIGWDKYGKLKKPAIEDWMEKE